MIGENWANQTNFAGLYMCVLLAGLYICVLLAGLYICVTTGMGVLEYQHK